MYPPLERLRAEVDSAKRQQRLTFDPKGTGYDYLTAARLGVKPDTTTGRLPAFDPQSGRMLRGLGGLTEDDSLALARRGLSVVEENGQIFARRQSDKVTEQFAKVLREGTPPPPDFADRLENAFNSFVSSGVTLASSGLGGAARAIAGFKTLQGDLSARHAWAFAEQTKKFGDSVREMFPGNPRLANSFLWTVLPQAFGSGVGFIAATAASGPAAPITPFALGAFSNAESRYQAAIEKGRTQSEALNSYLWGATTGTLEGIPIAGWFRRVARMRGGEQFISALRAAMVQGGEESATEALQGVLDNLGDIVLFGEERGLFDDVLTQAAAGGIVGGMLGGASAKIGQFGREQELRRVGRQIREESEQFTPEEEEQIRQAGERQREQFRRDREVAGEKTFRERLREQLTVENDPASADRALEWLDVMARKEGKTLEQFVKDSGLKISHTEQIKREREAPAEGPELFQVQGRKSDSPTISRLVFLAGENQTNALYQMGSRATLNELEQAAMIADARGYELADDLQELIMDKLEQIEEDVESGQYASKEEHPFYAYTFESALMTANVPRDSLEWKALTGQLGDITVTEAEADQASYRLGRLAAGNEIQSELADIATREIRQKVYPRPEQPKGPKLYQTKPQKEKVAELKSQYADTEVAVEEDVDYSGHFVDYAERYTDGKSLWHGAPGQIVGGKFSVGGSGAVFVTPSLGLAERFAEQQATNRKQKGRAPQVARVEIDSRANFLTTEDWHIVEPFFIKEVEPEVRKELGAERFDAEGNELPIDWIREADVDVEIEQRVEYFKELWESGDWGIKETTGEDVSIDRIERLAEFVRSQGYDGYVNYEALHVLPQDHKKNREGATYYKYYPVYERARRLRETVERTTDLEPGSGRGYLDVLVYAIYNPDMVTIESVRPTYGSVRGQQYIDPATAEVLRGEISALQAEMDNLTSQIDPIEDKSRKLHEKLISKDWGEAERNRLKEQIAALEAQRDPLVREWRKKWHERSRAQEELAQEIIPSYFQESEEGEIAGSFQFVNEVNRIIQLARSADAGTVLHELGHFFRTILSAEEQALVDKHYRIGKRGWTRLKEERFAEDIAEYMAKRKAPTKNLEGIFRRFVRWVRDFFELTTEKESDLSPEVQELFDRIFGLDVDLSLAEGPPISHGPSGRLGSEPTDDVSREEAQQAVFTALRGTNADISKMLETLGWDDLLPKEQMSWAAAFQMAKEKGYDKQAMHLAGQVIAEDRMPSRLEAAGIHIRLAEANAEHGNLVGQLSDVRRRRDLSDRRKTAEINSLISRMEQVKQQMAFLWEAHHNIGTELGWMLNMRKAYYSATMYDLTTIMQEAEAIKGSPLTQEEIDRFVDEHRNYQQTVEEAKVEEAKSRERDRIRRRKQAASALAATQRELTKSQQRAEELEKQRAELIEELKRLDPEMFNNLFMNGGLHAKWTADKLFTLGKFLRVEWLRHAELTGKRMTIDELTDYINKLGIDVDAEVITYALTQENPDPKTKKPTEAAEARKAFNKLKSKARHLRTINDMVNGILAEPTPGTPTPIDVKARKKIIAELKKELFATELEERQRKNILRLIAEAEKELGAVKGNEPATLEAARKRLADLRAQIRFDEDIQKLLRDIERVQQGKTEQLEYERKTRTKTRHSHEYLRKLAEKRILEAKLNKMLQDLKPYTRREFQQKGMSWWDAAVAATKRQWRDWLLIARPLLATGDMSGVARQGLIGSSLSTYALVGSKTGRERARIFSGAFNKAYNAFWDSHKAHMIMASMEQDPLFPIALEYGLFFSPLDYRPNSREELYDNKLLEKFAPFRVLTAPSERHMVTFLNMLRFGMWSHFYESYKGTFETIEKEEEAMRTYAKWVNVASGRGEMDTNVANWLSAAFFAPRFMWSRFQALSMGLKAAVGAGPEGSIPAIRKAIAADMLATITNGLGVMAMASLAGASVSWDPRDSDFGKVVFGNIRFDLFGGMLPIARLFTWATTATLDRAGITGKHLPKNMKGFNSYKTLYSETAAFFSYKLSPPIHVIASLMMGKTVVGEPTNFLKVMYENHTPIVFQEMIEGWQHAGMKGTVMVGVPAFFGIGTQTYGDALKRGDMKKMLSSAGYVPRRPQYPEWVKEEDREETDELFAEEFYQKVLLWEEQLHDLPKGPQRKKALEVLADQARYEVLERIGVTRDRAPSYDPIGEAYKEPEAYPEEVE